MRGRDYGGPLYGWTFHQSHDQATVLFLVPHTTSANDLDIRIASDHVIASVHNQPPILQAKLYGRINTETSTWRIADRDRTRKRRSRSLVRSPPAAESTSGSGSADAPMSRRVRAEPRTRQSTGPSDSTSPSSQTSGSHIHVESPPASHSSMSASIASLHSGSSYEVLSHSTPSSLPVTSAGPATEWSSGSSDFGSSDSANASLHQSVVLSDPGDLQRYRHDTGSAAEPMESSTLRRSRSISNLASSSSSASASTSQVFEAPQASPSGGPPEVRLVSLHLDKVDTGIWPLLVIGPAPLQNAALSSRVTRLLHSELPSNGLITQTFAHDRIQRRRGLRQEEQQRSAAQVQLNQALEEALSGFEGGDRVLAAIRRGTGPLLHQDDSRTRLAGESRTSMDSDEDLGPNTSTLSINTVGSDESATVLGSRIASLSGTSMGLQQMTPTARQAELESEEEDEVLEAWKEIEVLARYNMDPTTLSLIGLQYANSHSAQRGSTLATQFARTPSSAIPDAFEYFARAWRAADVSLATERLVKDFLPLLPATANGAGHQDHGALYARLVEVLEPSLVNSAMSLPGTAEVISTSLRERLHSHSYMSHRQRLVASLGGPRALSRLYVCYARLHLPSLESNRSPLAFPYGQLTSPFVSGGQGRMRQASNLPRRSSRNQTSATSSRTPSIASLTFGADGGAASPSKSTRAPNSPTVAESSRVASPEYAPATAAASRLDFSDFVIQADDSTASQPAPFFFFREACLLDSDVAVQISAQEWVEALALALESEERRAAELDGLAQAEEMGSLAGDSESGCLTFESDSEVQRRRAHRRAGVDSGRSSAGLGGLFSRGWHGDAAAGEAPPRKRSGKAQRRTEKGKRRKDPRRPNSARDRGEAGVINFVSGAALLGVALAGSVAALGWWRRTSAAINSSA